MPPFAPSDWPRNEFRAEAEVLWQWHYAAQAGEDSSVHRSKAHAICDEFNLPAHLVDAQFIEEGVPTIHTITDLFDYMVPVRKSPIFEILNGLGHQMLG